MAYPEAAGFRVCRAPGCHGEPHAAARKTTTIPGFRRKTGIRHRGGAAPSRRWSCAFLRSEADAQAAVERPAPEPAIADAVLPGHFAVERQAPGKATGDPAAHLQGGTVVAGAERDVAQSHRIAAAEPLEHVRLQIGREQDPVRAGEGPCQPRAHPQYALVRVAQVHVDAVRVGAPGKVEVLEYHLRLGFQDKLLPAERDWISPLQ